MDPSFNQSATNPASFMRCCHPVMADSPLPSSPGTLPRGPRPLRPDGHQVHGVDTGNCGGHDGHTEEGRGVDDPVHAAAVRHPWGRRARSSTVRCKGSPARHR